MYSFVTTAFLLYAIAKVSIEEHRSAAVTVTACVLGIMLFVAVSGVIVMAHRLLSWVT